MQPIYLPSRTDLNNIVGRQAMIDRAYRHVFGKPVEHEERTAMQLVMYLHVKNGEAPRMMKFKEELGRALHVCPQTASTIIKCCVAAGWINSAVHENDERVQLFWLDESKLYRMRQLAGYFGAIERAIAAQNADLKNPEAGAEHLPREIYYNAGYNHTIN